MDLSDHSRRFLAGDRFTFAQAAQQIFTALLNESQHQSIAFLSTVFGVVALASTLLVAEQVSTVVSISAQTLEETRDRVEGPIGAALILGLHPSTLRSKMRKMGIKVIAFVE